MTLALVEASSGLESSGQRLACPPVLVVPELMGDELLCELADQMMVQARYAGAVAIQQSGEAQPSKSASYTSLKEAIHAAANGDQEARRLVEVDARTDALERIFKAGCVMRTELAVDSEGRLMQHGQLMTDVYLNALRHTGTSPQMRARLLAETRNGVRLDALRRGGWLDGYYFVVVSRCPDDMPADMAADVGFFMDTASTSIQAFTVGKDGIPVQEVAFVAGKAYPDAKRHDATAVADMLAALGVDIGGQSATATLSMPLLVPKSRMPNGVVDLVPLYDQALATFFGQAGPKHDYLQRVERYDQQFAELEPIVQRIVGRVLARAHTITTLVQATQTLNRESQYCLLDQALGDDEINPRVFGVEAARHIEAARLLLARNDLDGFMEARVLAQQTARSFSCPGEVRGDEDEVREQSQQSSSDEDCDFVSKSCPLCGKKNVYTRVTKAYIKGSCGCIKRKS